MASLNKVFLIGNLTRDVELKNAGSTVVANTSLAVNRTWFDKSSQQKKEEVTFVEVTMFGKTAELAEQYLSKGKPVFIEGRLKLDTWEDRDTGAKRSKLHVICESMQFLGSKNDGGGSREPQWKNTGEESQDVPERKTADYFPDDDSVPF